MAIKNAIVDYEGKLEELRVGDNLTGSSNNFISGTSVFNFLDEQDIIINTIANLNITNTNIKAITIINQETAETSLDDFSLNGVQIGIENIINNVSFDLRATAMNNASGNYTANYKINY